MKMGCHPSQSGGCDVIEHIGLDMTVPDILDTSAIISIAQTIVGKPLASNEEAAIALTASIFGDIVLDVCSSNWGELQDISESQSSTPSTQHPTSLNITRALRAERAALCRTAGLVSLASHCPSSSPWRRHPQPPIQQGWGHAGVRLLLG
eukprot:gnl/Chilomastix_caulleri/4963.p1 GENE.gnl/Chilomastix_caulleri/4963~~gnl/Chilomastix_caulleri/4963.p1  ORF type:complete len:150 (+),score=48.59 gnl/Chilomastix_caulleri/4963:372-821(+)